MLVNTGLLTKLAFAWSTSLPHHCPGNSDGGTETRFRYRWSFSSLGQKCAKKRVVIRKSAALQDLVVVASKDESDKIICCLTHQPDKSDHCHFSAESSNRSPLGTGKAANNRWLFWAAPGTEAGSSLGLWQWKGS